MKIRCPKWRRWYLTPFSMARLSLEDSVYFEGPLSKWHSQTSMLRKIWPGLWNLDVLEEGLKDSGTFTYRRDCLVENKAAVYSYLKTNTWKKFHMTSEEGETQTSGYSWIENKFWFNVMFLIKIGVACKYNGFPEQYGCPSSRGDGQLQIRDIVGMSRTLNKGKAFRLSESSWVIALVFSYSFST